MPFEATEPLGWLSFLFLFLVVAMCAGALLSRRALEGGEELPPPSRLMPQVALQLLFVLAFALLAARDAGIELPVTRASLPRALLVGAGGLALMLASAPLLWRFTSEAERARRARFLPRDRHETILCLLVSVLAGLGEEVAWRAVLPALVAHFTGGVWLPVLVSAAAFGLAHMVQGKLASAAVFGFALVFHGIVFLTGDLWTAVSVHAAYDALVTTVIGPRLHRRSLA